MTIMMIILIISIMIKNIRTKYINDGDNNNCNNNDNDNSDNNININRNHHNINIDDIDDDKKYSLENKTKR